MVDIFPRAYEAIVKATDHFYDMSEFTPTLFVDSVLDPKKIDQHFLHDIDSLRPFGQ